MQILHGAKICPAADACRSSNRTLFGTGIVLNIEKLDKESKSTNFALSQAPAWERHPGSSPFD
ncbi:hypothetical protein, partial [Methylotuvimicrobium sp.]|uniref:hypothetical protein n=1 Tax=Methylotuvimicrobium sp. TaxID=2822413 RepID=UPI003D653956